MPRIKKNDCIGCELCTNICPEVFEIGKDGKAQVRKDADLKSKGLKDAIESCPNKAIIK